MRFASRTWTWGVSLTLAGALAAAQQQDPTRPGPHETRGDPPGKAAFLSPGRSPAGHVARGRFRTTQVNVDSQGLNIVGDAANEPSIAVDVLQPARIAIGWREFATISSNFRQAGVAYTANGGTSWVNPGPLDPTQFRTDPVLASDASGAFYYYSLFDFGATFRCDVFKSLDGGRTWAPPIIAYGGDKAWITVDRSGGLGDGNIYSEWSTFASCCGSNVFTRSTDGGATWASPSTVPSSPLWGTLAVGADGALYVAGRSPQSSSMIQVAKSTNAQNPQAATTFDFVKTVDLGGGLSASTGPNPGGLLGQVWVATHPTKADELYLLSSVNPPGPDPLDVRFARSTDGGQTWSLSVRVNDDATGSNAWQWFGTMSVAPGGRIDVVWNDTRASGSSNVSELYYASSLDGGLTWSANEAASPPWNSHLGWPNQNKIGDYYHMVSEAGGAHLAWAATFNGEQDVYYTRILP